MRLSKLGILCAALFVGGCASTADYSWQRRDGRLASGESFDYAISECRRISGRHDEEIMQRCMARYGYVWAPRPADYCYSDCRYSEYRPPHHHRGHQHHRRHYDD